MAPHQTSPELRDDATLLTLIRRGDEQAMASFYDRYSRIVYSVALRVLHHPASAEEILEQIFLEIWRNPERLLALHGSSGAWLVLATRNHAIDALQRRSSSAVSVDLLPAIPYDLSNEIERAALAEKMHAVVSHLPRDQRKVLEMAFFDGLTHTEIAEFSGESLPVIQQKLCDALLILRKASLA